MTDRPPRLFALAPMSASIRTLTWLVLALAPLFVVIGAATLEPAFGWVGGGLGVVYTVVWLVARPAGFALQPTALWVVFPLWRKAIPWESVREARAFVGVREELGLPVRVGVGGLWGVFGWLWTSKRGWVEVYASRVDGLVLVERRGARPVLLAPADPEAFIEEASYRAAHA